MKWLRDRWPYLTYTAGILVTLAALFIWVVPAAADAPTSAASFIAQFEGFRPDPYFDSGGCVTVGYGHLLTCDKDAELADFGSMTREDAQAFLQGRVDELIVTIRHDLRGGPELSEDQIVALASLCYNIGAGACAGSDLFRMIRDGEPDGEIARELLTWDHVGHLVNRGLSHRRLREIGLYFFGTSDLR